MYLILVNGGGSSPFDKIAKSHGWKLGINSLKKTSGKDLFMIDNPFQDYDHQRHLEAVKKYHPHLATIPDILEDSDHKVALRDRPFLMK